MDGQEIIEFFVNLVDDGEDLDQDFLLGLATAAKDKVEGERPWEMLKKKQTGSAVTGGILLPDDYGQTVAMRVNGQKYRQVPYEQQDVFENSALAWYLALGEAKFYLSGANLSGTYKHFYCRTTDPLTVDTSPIWPERFHKLIPYEMAELYYAIDQGDRVRAWDDKWTIQKTFFRNLMVDWDTALQIRANENQIPEDVESGVDLGSM